MRITGPSKAGRENIVTPLPNTYEAGDATIKFGLQADR